MVLCHAQAVEGNERLAFGEAGNRFGRQGQREEGCAGQADARWPAAHQARDFAQHAGQGHILATQNVKLADLPPLECCQMLPDGPPRRRRHGPD